MLESDTSFAMRRFLLLTLAVGIIGTSVELVLLEHIETLQQQIPLFVLALGTLMLAWHTVAPRAATVRGLQAAMTLFVITGLIGIWLHYRGNVEFELEMYPSMSGMELVQKTLTGATPVLAPGSMTLLGLIGLTHAYRHPSSGEDAGLPHAKGDS